MVIDFMFIKHEVRSITAHFWVIANHFSEINIRIGATCQKKAKVKSKPKLKALGRSVHLYFLST